MNLKAPPTYQPGTWQQLLGILGKAIDGCFTRGQDIRLNGERFTIKSPDGSEWSLTIDNVGATTWTKL